ncbi:metallopeptidase family M24-domain-containing protein [Mrakia frigida]|uniref:aminopeptidase P family protein n=1 Tax=Mrakia frigida TaxID=29902 RepID=UPI003FCC0597
MSTSAKYPALVHAQKVVEELAKTLPAGDHTFLVVSHETPFRNDTDREMPHRQESNFFYLTGCDIPGSALVVEFTLPLAAPSNGTESFKHTLYIPDSDPESIMWSIPPPSIPEVISSLQTQTVFHLPLPSSLSTSSTSTLHTLPPTPLFPTLPDFIISASTTPSSDSLLPAIHLARLLKDGFEIDLMEKAVAVTSNAHEVVMRELGKFAGGKGVAGKGGRGGESRDGGLGLKEWEIEGEGDAEAVFVAVCRRGGSKHLAYMPIIASGMRAATLHYICNHSPFTPTGSATLPTTLTSSAFTAAAPTNGHSSHDHDHTDATTDHTHSDALDLTSLQSDWKPQVLLIDAGAEYSCYGADVTRTMPVGNGGKFTKEAGEIYDLVLKMQKECEAFCAPGVHWDEVHLLAHQILVKGLLELGILIGEEAEVLRSGVGAAFFPHGLGHSLGLDVHDVPSASKPLKNTTLPSASLTENPEFYAYLRLRLPLAVGMIVTIEPGCYFSPHLLAPVRSSPFIDHEVLKRYESVGGVRIEDVVVVEETGVRNLTPAVRERSEVERLCSGSW